MWENSDELERQNLPSGLVDGVLDPNNYVRSIDGEVRVDLVK